MLEEFILRVDDSDLSMIKTVANFIGSRVLLPDNKRVVFTPDSPVPERTSQPLILVPTMLRTGTHLLIDLILNNFPTYRRNPLYVDLDRLHRLHNLRQFSESVDHLITCGGYVIKTHYPQTIDHPDIQNAIQRMIDAGCYVITTHRDHGDTLQSYLRFTERDASSASRNRMADHTISRFNDFWHDKPKLVIPFDAMTSPQKCPQVIDQIAKNIHSDPSPTIILPYRREQRLRVYFSKFLTRLIGHRAPIVNTTITFAR